MKLYLIVPAIFLTLTATADDTDVPKREPFTLTLAIDSERQYEQEIEAIPYVQHNIVYLFKGDIVGVSFTENEGELPEARYDYDIEKADVLFRFSQKRDKDDGTLTMLLAIDNRMKKELFMDGLLVVPNKSRAFETTLLPLKPGTTNYESWPHPIVQLAIRNLRFQEEKPEKIASPIPVDRVVTLKDARIEELIRTYSAMSRKELPGVLTRFKNGLAEGSKFFVTTRIDDPAKESFEQVFVKVDSIEGDTLSGNIASNLSLITNYRNGDPYSCPESKVLDWTIQNADGTGEGNYIGKFMNVVRDDVVHLIIETEIKESGEVTAAKFDRAINRYKQDISFCIPDKARQEAEDLIMEITYPETDKPGKYFIHALYRFHDDVVELPEKKKGE